MDDISKGVSVLACADGAPPTRNAFGYNWDAYHHYGFIRRFRRIPIPFGMYLITPSAAELDRGLEAWQWIGLNDKTPVAVTAFGDVFFVALTGIWFLDTIEGTLRRVCGSREELAKILESDEGKNLYLLAGFVQRAVREGKTLGPGECYDFTVAPILGGKMGYENVEKRNLIMALRSAGQLHEQMRNRTDGSANSSSSANPS